MSVLDKFGLPRFKKYREPTQVLFHRDYLRFQGGHLKVWHYFNHLQNSKKYLPKIYFSKQSIFDESNPWENTSILSSWQPDQADILFLAGLDWQAVLDNQAFLNKRKSIPIINLVQGLSHADIGDIKYKFLKEKAIRICVSKQVADAIQATNQVNGPIFTITNGVDLKALPAPLSSESKDIELLIVAIKKPELGVELQGKLSSKFKKLVIITKLLPRAEFLDLLNRARVCLCLPHLAEGFYLPALEAMALNTLVICPDCIGNRSFCVDGNNCFQPTYEKSALIATVQRAVSLTIDEHYRFLLNARKTVDNHSLQSEANQFLDIMNNVKKLW